MNYRQNVPPGCHPDDTGPGGEDTYTCAGCTKAVHENALDPDSDEPMCSQCALEERERVREEDAEVRAQQEVYLGDRLYARFDGYQIWLRAPRAGGDHVVAMKPAVWAELVRWQQSLATQGRCPVSDTTTTAKMQGSKACNYCLGMGCLHCLGKGTVPVTPQRVWPTPTDLADAQLELDIEKVERALEWQRCKEQVKALKEQMQQHMAAEMFYETCVAARRLVQALDELERLESAGGGL